MLCLYGQILNPEQYLDNQREARRYNDQIEEERFRQRKVVESIEREREVFIIQQSS